MPANSLFHPGGQLFFFKMKMVPLRRLCWNYFQTAKQKCPKILGLGDSRATEICQRPKRGSGRILVALETSIFCLNPIPFERQADYCSYVMLYPMSNVDANQTGCWYPQPPVNGLKVKELLLQAWHGGGTAREIPPVTYEGQNQWCPGLDQCYLRFDALGSRRWFQNISDDCRPRRSVLILFDSQFLFLSFFFMFGSPTAQ